MASYSIYIFFTISIHIGLICAEIDRLDLIEQFLGDELPKLIGQRPNNENGTKSDFKYYALNDKSNEDVGRFTEQELIERSGFKYENHYVLSNDGYITQIIRVINPLIDQSKLKQPPVVLTHGSFTSSSSFLWASPIQHHPEQYPRLSDETKERSWNRSLGFTLANNAYDVWLLPTRGSNRQSRGHLEYKVYRPPSLSCLGKGHKKDNNIGNLVNTFKYWDYSMDQIVEFELTRQIDKVLQVTGAKKVSFISFALANMKSIPLISSSPDYAEKVHNYVMIAPIITHDGTNKLIQELFKLVAATNYDLGTAVLSQVLCTEPTLDIVLAFAASRRLRYSTIKSFSSLVFGASAKYNTLLDPAVLGHTFQGSGFKELQHYCQQVLASNLQKYDRGPIENVINYGHLKPPVYDLSKFNVKNLLVISASNDNIATPSSVKMTLERIGTKPVKHIVVPEFNHLDLIAAFENDIYVNLPTIEFLDKFQLEPLQQTRIQNLSIAKEQEFLEQFVPKEMSCQSKL